MQALVSAMWNGVPNNFFERKEGFWNSVQDEHDTSSFSALRKSQREDWYKVTHYVAEFWCTVSNIGFLCVGITHRSFEFIFAGCASIASHAIPKQWLLTVDKIGAVVAFLRLLREYKVILTHPWLLIPATVVGILFIADIYFAQTRADTWPHVAWHLSSAYTAHLILQNSI